ncbi:T9SS type A sorting domain-containing protein [Lacinutrix jangbogonensis]|uniref:T9SS type A sorting domain-containing protein n=1 Tax=Lacinutrix jangbogonensis TaxID=1469557 RepID=UPI0009E01001
MVLSVNEFESLILQVSTNTINGIINIKLQDSSDITIQIINLSGKVISTKDYNNLEIISININYLQSAVYFLKVTTASGATNTAKITKE